MKTPKTAEKRLRTEFLKHCASGIGRAIDELTVLVMRVAYIGMDFPDRNAFYTAMGTDEAIDMLYTVISERLSVLRRRVNSTDSAKTKRE